MSRIKEKVARVRTRARMIRYGIGRSCCGNGEIGHCSCQSCNC